MTRLLASTSASLAIAAAVGCSSPKVPLDQPVGVTTVRAAPEPTPSPPASPGSADVRREAAPDCLAGTPSVVFDEGSAVITPKQDLELQRITRCLLDGAFANASVVVVGHADAVGGSRENAALALERAAKVRAFLVARGVDAERVLATSAGERTTKASSPGRRADIVVTPRALPAPPRTR